MDKNKKLAIWVLVIGLLGIIVFDTVMQESFLLVDMSTPGSAVCTVVGMLWFAFSVANKLLITFGQTSRAVGVISTLIFILMVALVFTLLPVTTGNIAPPFVPLIASLFVVLGWPIYDACVV